jgi:hypothetical protein
MGEIITLSEINNRLEKILNELNNFQDAECLSVEIPYKVYIKKKNYENVNLNKIGLYHSIGLWQGIRGIIPTKLFPKSSIEEFRREIPEINRLQPLEMFTELRKQFSVKKEEIKELIKLYLEKIRLLKKVEFLIFQENPFEGIYSIFPYELKIEYNYGELIFQTF